MNDIKEIYKTAGVEYNEGYTLDTFEQEFSEAQSEKEISGIKNIFGIKGGFEYGPKDSAYLPQEQANAALNNPAVDNKVNQGQKIMVKALSEKLKLIEAERVKTESAVTGKLAVLNIELERVEGNLAGLEKQLLPEFLVQYKRLVSNRSEDSMAALDDVSCGGCYTGLPPRILDSLRKEQAIVCPSCGRLLYRPER